MSVSVRRKPHVGCCLPSCRFICVSKKSRKYFSLSLSIHMPHLDAGWINLISFSSERFFNRTILGAEKTAVRNCVAMNFRFIVLLLIFTPRPTFAECIPDRTNIIYVDKCTCTCRRSNRHIWNSSKQRLLRIFRKIKLIIPTKEIRHKYRVR